MYALVDPKSFWPGVPAMPTLPANQIYMAPVPATPTYLIGGAAGAPPTHHHHHVLPMAPTTQHPPLQQQQQQQQHHHHYPATTPSTSPTTPALYYNLQPTWTHQNNNTYNYNHNYNHVYHQPAYTIPDMTSLTRQRTSSDDVFIVETPAPHHYAITLPSSTTTDNNKVRPLRPLRPLRPIRRQRAVAAADDDNDDVMSLESSTSPRPSKSQPKPPRPRSNSLTASSDSSGSEFSPQSSRTSGSSSKRSSMSPHHVTRRHDSMDQSASSGSHKEAPSIDINDFSLFNIFSTSLYSALNRDPPDPSAKSYSKNSFVIPLKTSSPIPEEKKISGGQIRVVSEKVAFVTKQNKTTIKHQIASPELEQFHSNVEDDEDVEDVLEGQTGSRRQLFLRALEEERDRQRNLILPRHAPKMNCKFCKNNGESLEVYTKHRLHFKEKTVCPLLRMYVCRLCNSTGDFAHTIRHCPFNARFDKIAWKATFL